MSEKFSIYFREYQLEIPPIVYHLTHGRPISHSYLALTQGGKTIEEIHGMAFVDQGDSKYKLLDMSLASIFAIFSNNLHPRKDDIKLKTIVLKDRETKFASESLVHRCTNLTRWEQCKREAHKINLSDISYKILTGKTCHSVTGTILMKVFEHIPSSKYATPALDSLI